MKPKDNVPDIDFNDPIDDDEDERQPARRVPAQRRRVFRGPR